MSEDFAREAIVGDISQMFDDVYDATEERPTWLKLPCGCELFYREVEGAQVRTRYCCSANCLDSCEYLEAFARGIG